jgi:hypothetical protein
MSQAIANLIASYSNNFVEPASENEEAYEASRDTFCAGLSDEDLSVLKKQRKVTDLVSRFFWENEVGEIQVRDLSQENFIATLIIDYSGVIDDLSSEKAYSDTLHDARKNLILLIRRIFNAERFPEFLKKASLKVTYFTDSFYQYYSVWQDRGSLSSLQGMIKLDVLRKQPYSSNRYRSVLYQKETDIFSSYARGVSKMLLVCTIESYGNFHFHGIGSNLMQIAVENSQKRGCNMKVCLFSALGSIAFYRKAFFSTGLKDNDDKIDREICLARREYRDPNISGCGSMVLDEVGARIYAEKIFRNPILSD